MMWHIRMGCLNHYTSNGRDLLDLRAVGEL